MYICFLRSELPLPRFISHYMWDRKLSPSVSNHARNSALIFFTLILVWICQLPHETRTLTVPVFYTHFLLQHPFGLITDSKLHAYLPRSCLFIVSAMSSLYAECGLPIWDEWQRYIHLCHINTPVTSRALFDSIIVIHCLKALANILLSASHAAKSKLQQVALDWQPPFSTNTTLLVESSESNYEYNRE